MHVQNLKLFQNLAIYYKTSLRKFSNRTHRTSIQANYIYFMKSTIEFGVCVIIRPFGV